MANLLTPSATEHMVSKAEPRAWSSLEQAQVALSIRQSRLHRIDFAHRLGHRNNNNMARRRRQCAEMLLTDGIFQQSNGGWKHDIFFQFIQYYEADGVSQRRRPSHVSALLIGLATYEDVESSEGELKLASKGESSWHLASQELGDVII
jgi:hypothetical protein